MRKPYLQFVDYFFIFCVNETELIVICSNKKLSNHKIFRFIILEKEKTSLFVDFCSKLILLLKFQFAIHIKEHLGHLNNFF